MDGKTPLLVYEMVPHLPYYPDLAPCGNGFGIKRFSSNEEAITETEQHFGDGEGAAKKKVASFLPSRPG